MIRIQLDLPEDQVQELDELMKETKIVTRKDLINNALTLFQWAAKSKRAGRIVASLDEATGTARELVMPALENVFAQPPAKQPKTNLAQFLLNSPLPGSGLEVKRQQDTPQPIEL